jgi:methionine-gamma-lyase
MSKKTFTRGFETLCVSDRLPSRTEHFSHVPPIHATSTFVYESAEKAMSVFQGTEEAYIYGRWHNPTSTLVEEKIALLESYGLGIPTPQAVLFSSGMAAISSTLLSLGLKQGDTVLTQGNLYGTTTEMLNTILGHHGIIIRYENLKDLELVEGLLKSDPSIKLIYIETPANPTLDCYDLKALSALAKQYGKLTAADNTFATPYLQQPLAHGIDFVMHSTTKFLNGHGNAIGGVVVGTNAEQMKQVWRMRKILGGSPSPFDAFLLNNVLKTLVLRMEKHCDNAEKVAEWLQAHPAVERVNYTGLPTHPDHELALLQMRRFGGILSFELKGGVKAGIKLMNGVKHCVLTASLGTADTLIQHPASMTHVQVDKAQRLKFGITDGLVRLSVGIEDVDDIIADLEQALGK